jgi:hypothetical protein
MDKKPDWTGLSSTNIITNRVKLTYCDQLTSYKSQYISHSQTKNPSKKPPTGSCSEGKLPSPSVMYAARAVLASESRDLS